MSSEAIPVMTNTGVTAEISLPSGFTSGCVDYLSDIYCFNEKTIEDMNLLTDNHSKQLIQKLSRIGMNGTQEEYPKDSLDRLGDDLCGLVLSYLSLKDSFRYECLSKQWRRTVFTRRHTLEVNRQMFTNWHLSDNKRSIDNIWRAMKSVVNKCPNITSIDIKIKTEANERVFSLLMLSSIHSLIEIRVDLNYANHEIVDWVLSIYGPQLTSILIHTYGYQMAKHAFKRHSKSLTRLRQLSGRNTDLSLIFNDNKLIVKTLTDFEFKNEMLLDKGINCKPHRSLFVDNYRHTLKSIAIDFVVTDLKQVIVFLRELLKGQTLRQISLGIDFICLPIGYKTYHEFNKFLAIDCKRVKRFGLNLSNTCEPKVRQLYESMQWLTRLQRLELKVLCNEDIIELTPKSMSLLKRLTHLSLDFGFCVLNESFFDSIDTHLPFIQSLKINSGLEITRGIEASVKRLSDLKSIKKPLKESEVVVVLGISPEVSGWQLCGRNRDGIFGEIK
ncbi:unnamed protein product [Oppiella nova]|uniref:F-box domain-containing protein n=1 Tax=Oppiella nova TaxID=334625 RepID=A0A7R9LES1_9ACAR|nr:unnamed protein product [Oppiella nova]CAG2162930.1 unnamed protein product [Oppiella nova]